MERLFGRETDSLTMFSAEEETERVKPNGAGHRCLVRIDDGWRRQKASQVGSVRGSQAVGALFSHREGDVQSDSADERPMETLGSGGPVRTSGPVGVGNAGKSRGRKQGQGSKRGGVRRIVPQGS